MALRKKIIAARFIFLCFFGTTLTASAGIATLRERVAGHDAVMWRESFGDALLTEFGKIKPRSRRKQ